ncbi:MAG: NapC/NirT family cytochrome c [Actinobacteria bacterium]|nr:NapC/NirT family cytochrome c [Actinomycetota bacterium]
MKLKGLTSLKGLSLVAVLLLFFGGISYAGFEATSTNEFCGSCHVMERAYESWYHSAHREPISSCEDCHLPKNLGNKIVYKIGSGANDIYKNLTGPPDVIHAKDNTREIVNENCVSCHAELITKIDLSGGGKCVDCHRGTPHGR